MDEPNTPTIAVAAEKSVETAEATVRRPFVRKLARVGFLAKGILFIVIGALALLLAAGLPEGMITDPSGALAVIAEQPFGRVLLFGFIVGASGHAVWNILRGVADVDDAGGGFIGYFKRSVAAGVGLFYFGLALTAFEKIMASRVSFSPGQAEETLVTVLLAVPILGALLLFLIGIGVIGAGFHECYAGFSGRFRDAYRVWEIKGRHLILITALGVLSFTARAVILVIMGYFFLAAAWSGLNGSIGLDAALYALTKNSYGRIALFTAASGLIAHGVLAFYEAKYRRIC